MDITNEQWERIAPLLSESQNRNGRGRPVSNDPRKVLNGILWILRTGAPWKDLPERYPPYQTCHRWLQQWRKTGVLDALLITLAEDLRDCGKLDLREAFIDGTFAPAKKRGGAVGKTKRGKGTKNMAVADAYGLPLAAHVASASPHEVSLVEETLKRSFINELPERLNGDKAYDSDPLDATLAEDWGIEMIAPNQRNRHKTQDGRTLRRYCRRWKVERLFAWLQNFRRLVVRYQFHMENFLAMVQLACIIILLRNL